MFRYFACASRSVDRLSFLLQPVSDANEAYSYLPENWPDGNGEIQIGFLDQLPYSTYFKGAEAENMRVQSLFHPFVLWWSRYSYAIGHTVDANWSKTQTGKVV